MAQQINSNQALQILASALQKAQEESKPKNPAMARIANRQVEAKESRQLKRAFAAAARSPRAREILAATLVSPLRHYLDYAPINRSLWVVEEYPPAIPMRRDYDLNWGPIGELDNVMAARVADNGRADHYTLIARRLELDPFNIAFNGYVRYEDTVETMFNVVDRLKDKAGIAMALLEDTRFLNLLDAQSTVTNDETSVSTLATRTFLAAMRREIEEHRLNVTAFLGGPNLPRSIQTWQIQELGIDLLDEVNKQGYIGSWGGVEIHVTNLISSSNNEEKVYALTDDEHLGWMPIRQTTKVQMVNYPDQMLIGVAAWQRCGMSVWNSYGVSRGVYATNVWA